MKGGPGSASAGPLLHIRGQQDLIYCGATFVEASSDIGASGCTEEFKDRIGGGRFLHLQPVLNGVNMHVYAPSSQFSCCLPSSTPLHIILFLLFFFGVQSEQLMK